jgi:hypothetical protein
MSAPDHPPYVNWAEVLELQLACRIAQVFPVRNDREVIGWGVRILPMADLPEEVSRSITENVTRIWFQLADGDVKLSSSDRAALDTFSKALELPGLDWEKHAARVVERARTEVNLDP